MLPERHTEDQTVPVAIDNVIHGIQLEEQNDTCIDAECGLCGLLG
jgi:hypothetical protein